MGAGVKSGKLKGPRQSSGRPTQLSHLGDSVGQDEEPASLTNIAQPAEPIL